MTKKRKTPPAKFSDMGTPELRQHHTIIKEDADEHTTRAKNITQTPLDWYYAHDHITKIQWNAGDRIYRDFTHAGVYPSTVSNYINAIPSGNKQPTMTDNQIDARRRLYEAIDQLEYEGQLLITHVCCYGKWPYEEGLERRYASQRLRSALDELAIHYGFTRKGEKR